ncbi:ribosomal RNA adenine dimethylase-domain-containing protein [Pyronema domesticum]|nr:ribosomal RNA adenine dimethylase-domain-containing protein [Pyronema domesticum]
MSGLATILKKATSKMNREFVTKNLITSRASKHTRYEILDGKLCGKIAKNLNLDAWKGTNIIEMNPGFGLLGITLNKALSPRSHILLEPDKHYHAHLSELKEDCTNMHIVKLDGYDWDTYSRLVTGPFAKKDFAPDYVPPQIETLPNTGDLNTSLLFIGNIAHRADSDRIVTQLLQTCFVGSWIQQFGRVRFILLVKSEAKERILPRVIQTRSRPSILASSSCEVTEVASAPGIRTGKGFQTSILNSKRLVGVDIKQLGEKADIDIKMRKPVDRILLNYNHWRVAEKQAGDKVTRQILYRKEIWEGKLRVAIGEYLSARFLEDYSALKYTDRTTEDLINEYETCKGKPRPNPLENQITPEQREMFSEFEEEYLIPGMGPTAMKKAVEDELYAESTVPKLLQAAEERNKDPLEINVNTQVHPEGRRITVVDFVPQVPHEYFLHKDPDVVQKRFLTFDWMVRSIFTLRAQTVKIALKSLVPGGEYILDEIPDGKGKELGKRRVRCLSTDDLITLARAWEAWPFKPIDEEYGGYSSQAGLVVPLRSEKRT